MSTINSATSYAIIANLLRASSEVNASVLNLSNGLKNNASVADFSVGSVLAYKQNAITTANVNAGQGKSLATTAKNALNQIIVLLQDQKNLATQATDDSLTDNERASLNLQFQSDTDQINRIATTTKFNNKVLLDGTASGVADLNTATGQAAENYTLLTTSDFSVSGTTASGDLNTVTPITAVATNSIGKTAATATISFAGAIGGVATNAVIQVNGSENITFTTGVDAATTATAFALAANTAAASSANTNIRKFNYTASGNTVIVTAADLGNNATTGAEGITFALTNRGAGTPITVDTVTFGGANMDTTGAGATRTITVNGTPGTNRTVNASDITIDANLQGHLSNFTATLDSSGPQNKVTFTVQINGQTYTSQAVTLFGIGGLDSQGNKIKAGQTITFYNPADATDTDGEITNNGFKLNVGASDITVSGTTANDMQTSLDTIIAGFATQLDANSINQSRSLILAPTNAAGGDYTIAAADGTLFEGIKTFTSTAGANAKGDINFVGDVFGSDGNNGTVGPFSFNHQTHKLTTTINGEVYTAILSDSTANTGGIVNGTGGGFNASTNVLTVGSTGTILVLHSASSTDGKELRIDLSNVAAGDINLDTDAAATIFTNDLNKVFGVAANPSLSFQVGSDATDTINVALSNSQTTALYKDDAGAGKTLDISTAAGATAAGDVLDNAIDNTLSRVATTSAAVNAFNSAIVTNDVMINNFESASSALLNTDYAEESTLLAQSTLKYNAAVAVLAQSQLRTQNLLKLLGS